MLDGANEIILVILNIPADLKKIARFARILVDYSGVPNKRVHPIKRVSWNFDH